VGDIEEMQAGNFEAVNASGEPRETVSRRGLAKVLGLGGLAALLTACERPMTREEIENTVQAVSASSNIVIVPTMIDLRQQTTMTGSGPFAALLLGYYVSGDGGGGLFYWDSVSTLADDGGTIVQPGSGPPSTLNPATAGRWIRVHDGHVSVRWFGAHGGSPGSGEPPASSLPALWYPSGAIRNVDAFTTAINVLRPVQSTTVADYAGLVVNVPAGDYLFDDTLFVGRSVHLRGVGGSVPPTSRLHFQTSPDKPGIHVARLATSGVVGPRGDYSTIESLELLGPGGSANVGHGIFAEVVCSIFNCFIGGFAGDGINIAGYTLGFSGHPNTGADEWQVMATRVDSCENGLQVRGDDSNVGLCSRFSATNCRGYGVLEASWLGNVFISVHTAGNSLGSFKTDAYTTGKTKPPSVFIGCYIEGGQPGPFIDAPSVVVGGAGLSANTGTAPVLYATDRIAQTTTTLRATDSSAVVNAYQDPTSPGTLTAFPVTNAVAIAGGSSHNGTALEFSVAFPGAAPNKFGAEAATLTWGLVFNRKPAAGASSGTAGWWEFNYGSSDLGTGVAFNSIYSPEWAEKFSDSTKAWFPNGAYIGLSSNRAYVGTATMPPPLLPTGHQGTAWKVGDIVLNTSPLPTATDYRRFAGWICTHASDSGHPAGQWVGYGALDGTLIG